MKLDTSGECNQQSVEPIEKRERESFYDNKQNDLTSDSSSSSKEPVNFRTEKSININHGPNDKDEFDDLIRLTHRATKQDKVSKSSSLSHFEHTNSSLPPLPPLPYSFVKLETNQKPKLTSSSTLILKNNKQKMKEETKCTKQPATTRLIIPINNTNNEKKNDCLDFFLISSTRNNNCNPGWKKAHSPSEIDVEIYHNSSKNKPQMLVKEKLSSSSSSSSEIENCTDSNSCSSSSDAQNASSLGDEWEQIGQIFASLESFLNEVVDSTCKTLRKNTKLRNSQTSHTLGRLSQELKYDVFKSKHEDSSEKEECFSQAAKRLFNKSQSDHLDTLLNKKKLKYLEITDFLKRIGLNQYEKNFLLNGYDDINFLNNVLSLQDLNQIGIENLADTYKILNEVRKLSSSIKKIESDVLRFSNIIEWLKYLNLVEYLENFMSNGVNTMKKAKRLWDIELSTVLQISLLGHRRRILASLHECIKLDEYDRKKKSTILNNMMSHSNSWSILSNNDSKDLLLNQASYPSLLSDLESFGSIKRKIKKCNRSASMSSSPSSASTLSFSTTNNSSHLRNFSCADLNCKKGQKGTTETNSKYKRLNSNSFMYSPILYSSLKTRHEKIPQKSDEVKLLSEQKLQPKPVWNSDPLILIKSSYNFSVLYLGSSAISKLKSNQDPIKFTIDRLKNTTKLTPYELPKVELGISINGIIMRNCDTKEPLFNYDIRHINNVCQDQDDLEYFALSTQLEPTAHFYCHVFSCRDKETATQIILTIGQAFDIAYELFCKNNFT